MKIRNTAAFVLIGWYLMLPPVGNSNAPLSKWEVGQSFDTAQACEDGKSGILATYVSTLSQIKKGKSDEQYVADPMAKFWFEQMQRTQSAQCIASDDSRLKSN